MTLILALDERHLEEQGMGGNGYAIKKKPRFPLFQ